MTKAELIDIVAEEVEGVSKADVARVHDKIFETIARALEVDGKFMVAGFGSFEVKSRSERKGRNPQTGQEITIAASKSVSFRQAGAMKDRLNK